MGLPYYRRGRLRHGSRGRGRGRPVHNTNFLDNFFNNLFWENYPVDFQGLFIMWRTIAVQIFVTNRAF